MTEELTPEETKKILSALDDALEKGPWGKSIFLRAIGKKLESVRDEFKSGVTERPGQAIEQILTGNKVNLRAEQQKVFVSLYCSNGADIKQWERIVTNLASQSITRPTYGNEKDIQTLIRSKPKKENEAYVSINISQRDILKVAPGRELKDRLGTQLLSLRDKAIKKENILDFYHLSGRYSIESGRLVRQGDVSYLDFHHHD